MKAVIDSVIIKNFISEKFMKKHNLLTQFKTDLYKLIIINDTDVIIMNEKIDKET